MTAATALAGLRVGDDRVADVLSGVDLTMCAGQAVGLIGPNGHGKPTLVRTIAGVLRMHGGSVRGGMGRVLGANVAPTRSAVRHRRGL